ncbi:MAG: glycine cleavage system protein [Gammaproteobacteria bacterium]|jgi:glycine cleavage system H protein|nr:glycine cleavage system protein [Gammaproteobacteria bacterium]
MNTLPQELRYTTTHEWVRIENDTATIGITEHAQSLLGDLVYVDLPPVKKGLAVGDDAAVVESVKAAADVYSPVDGEVIEVNAALNDKPELINQDPYGAGWLFKVKLVGELPLSLLSAADYEAMLNEE